MFRERPNKIIAVNGSIRRPVSVARGGLLCPGRINPWLRPAGRHYLAGPGAPPGPRTDGTALRVLEPETSGQCLLCPGPCYYEA